MATQLFNSNQLATYEEARELKSQIENFRITHEIYMAGGVADENKDVGKSGIYIPSWESGPGGFPEPNDAEDQKFFLHFRFNSGRSGINVGLILDKIRRFAGNFSYVFYYLNSGDLS